MIVYCTGPLTSNTLHVSKNLVFRVILRRWHLAALNLISQVCDQSTSVLRSCCKAFDTMPHRRLLHKIQHYGVEGLTNKWIGSWLCQRKQKVILDGYSCTVSKALLKSSISRSMVCLISSLLDSSSAVFSNWVSQE
jgi:methylaspartate ammonia-lyase